MTHKPRYTVIPRTMSFVFCGDEVLLLKANDTKDWSGHYDPLGGHIEIKEDILESAKREIVEESGLVVTDIKLRGIIHVTNFYGKNIIMFVTSSTTKTKEVRSNHEGDLEWVKINQLDQLPLLPDVKPILEKVIESEELFLGTSEFSDQGEILSLLFKK